ncbi:MAG: hypothetical protein RL367_1196, partial [Pseudomonadota bacterium]
YHQGDPIKRPAMVRLFSTILRREPDGSHVLVTPAEKLTIAVEDKPFMAVELKSEGEREQRTLAFRLNTGDLIIAGKDFPIGFDALGLMLRVQGGMEARLVRSLYYELADMALDEGANPPGVWSQGEFFVIGDAL